MARPRVVLDDDAWAAVRVAYEDTDEPVTRILARFGIQRHQLYDRIALENWRMRSSGVVKSAADVAPPVARPPPLLRAEPATSDPVVEGTGCSVEGDRPVQTHAERMERLYRIIDRLLEKMESNVVNNPNMTAQEQERAAKALTSTMTAMERMTDIADPKKAPETSDGGKNNDSAEAERMRREIAERLERLSAKLHDGTGKSE
jgi:hypothetical protein